MQYGRKSLSEIAREVDGKTEEEVLEYSNTFWKRFKELSDWERIIKNIGARCAAPLPPVPDSSCIFFSANSPTTALQ